MRLNLVKGLAAASLAIAPATAIAAQNPASALSLRAGAQMQNESGVEGDSTWLWVGLGAAALIAVILIASDDNNDNELPVSA
ncbi:MAG TPA: hypothetical protein VI381_03315 [Allosphingosinicella sp.]